MADELGERTEDPTGKRYSEAREKGQVAKSQDLAAAIDWAGVLIMLLLLGSLLVKSMGSVMRRSLEDAGGEDGLVLGNMTSTVLYSAGQSAVAVLPFFVAFVIVTVAAHFAQYGALFTSDPLQPDLNRLNPIAGFSRIFSAKGAVRTVLSLLKVLLVTVIAYAVIVPEVPLILQLPQLTLIGGLHRIWTMMLALAGWLIAVLLVLGVADFMYQRWMLKKDLMMTKQQVKEERKSMDGDPQVRGRRMQMMRAIAMQKVNQTVPQADVIVTNPTHFSVAIRYSQDEMAAPRVIAKGTDFMAMRIRQLAMINGVPMVERPALARALYYAIEVGQEVPQEHYQAVAEVLAYVYRLEGRAA
ncbi:MAG: flagellar biosynthesis protein FlhB [Phycisphaerae bacterium]|nr:flagellar biosynthesis protein FlhB [Phycisphaerae bacterium]MBN8597049.1 flagellar biosynthesis protein FlhB [Planctomycetota bacterium]